MAVSGNEKKSQQLGMNYSTASGRLVKDILFSLVVQTGKNTCHQCLGEMSRENFSIEHKTPWLDSEDPLKLFFDLDNISFSHLKCNFAAARKPGKIHASKNAANAASGRRVYASLPKEDRQRVRRAKYEKYKC